MEYADPSGIYPSFGPELVNRLPLRHLHWKSTSRPVRTIDSLRITLVADRNPLDVKNEVKNDGPNSESPPKKRRHQIPGLRQTPYLKVYLLQCSDVETYRASSRKLLRDWVKDHTIPSQSNTSLNTQENHDAFEWLIVHLLPAFTDEITSRPSSVARTESEKRQSSSKWPSRSSSSVIEKLRADFTSKNAVDRVTQVHMAGPSDEDSGHVQLRAQDENNGWEDMIAKMKSLILASFDLRVNQYEEDIREKESQRNLPGWNFNTFFILKEGLSRGFESVGLTEDALTGYHELAAGLNAIVDCQSGGETAGQQAALFSDHTEDLIEAFNQAVQCSKITGISWQEMPHLVDLGASILNTDRKPFRDLILANRISSFDFQNYVFARQVSLLLGLAGVTERNDLTIGAGFEGGSAVQSEVGIRLLKPNSESREELTILAEVAARACTFITSAATTLRNDIKSGMHPSDDAQNDDHPVSDDLEEAIVENLVASWIFSASKCILEATSASLPSAQLDPVIRQSKSSIESISQDNHTSEGSITNTVHRNGLPDRMSSLKAHVSIMSQSHIEEGFPSVHSADAVRLLPPALSHNVHQEYASRQGDLLDLARRALSSLGLQHLDRQGGLADVNLVVGAEEVEMQDVMLEDTTERKEKRPQSSSVNRRALTTAGVCNRTLLSAVQSNSNFYQVFEVY